MKSSKQLIVETRAPIPAIPGRAVRHDYEYERNGVANIFMIFAPTWPVSRSMPASKLTVPWRLYS